MSSSPPPTTTAVAEPESSTAVPSVASGWPDTSLLGVALIWGINIPIMKNGLDDVDSFVFNAIRLVVSATVLMAFALFERRRGHRIASGLSKGKLITYSIIVSGAYQVLFLLGIANTTSGNTALIISTIPMWTALLGRIFLDERLHKIAWLGLLIALVGTVMVALQKGDVSVEATHLFGNSCVLGAAIAWSIGTVYSRPMLKRISPMQLSAFSATMALPIHIFLASGNYQESLPALQSPQMWLIILYSGVLSTGLALPMWSYGVRQSGAAHAAIIQNLVPVVAIVAAWITRGETASTAQILGGLLILGGLVIMRSRRNAA